MKTQISPEDKTRRAAAYMQMSTQSTGWKYLRVWLEENVQEAVSEFVDNKSWLLSDDETTARIYRAQTRAWAYNKVMKHVDEEIKIEIEKREKASQGDSQK